MNLTRHIEKSLDKSFDLYTNADPFPHIVIDDFLPPAVINSIIDVFPKPSDGFWRQRIADAYQHKLASNKVDEAPEAIRDVLYQLNSATTLKALERLTGEGPLIADPFFEGGGLHQIERGGFLAVHADFNKPRHLPIYRRLQPDRLSQQGLGAVLRRRTGTVGSREQEQGQGRVADRQSRRHFHDGYDLIPWSSRAAVLPARSVAPLPCSLLLQRDAGGAGPHRDHHPLASGLRKRPAVPAPEHGDLPLEGRRQAAEHREPDREPERARQGRLRREDERRLGRARAYQFRASAPR